MSAEPQPAAAGAERDDRDWLIARHAANIGPGPSRANRPKAGFHPNTAKFLLHSSGGLR
jgi:hypothetical protein